MVNAAKAKYRLEKLIAHNSKTIGIIEEDYDEESQEWVDQIEQINSNIRSIIKDELS